MITTRRAEQRDAAHIDKLAREQILHSKIQLKNATASSSIIDIEKHLRQRFGKNINAEFLIDTSPMSIVGLDRHGNIVGFAAFSSSPPKYIDVINEKDNDPSVVDDVDVATMPQTNWASWISSQWQAKDIQLHNTKFLSFIVSSAAEGPAFLSSLLKSAFLSLSMTTNVGIFLPDTCPIFTPLSQPKYMVDQQKPESKVALAEGGHPIIEKSNPLAPQQRDKHRLLKKHGKDNHRLNKRSSLKDDMYFKLVPKIAAKGYNMYICTRNDVLPLFRVRIARVEDTDDLVPMLRKQKNDFFLETPNSTSKTLVVEVDSQVVGFMSLSSEFNAASLSATFDVSCFDNLRKDPDPENLSIEPSTHLDKEVSTEVSESTEISASANEESAVELAYEVPKETLEDVETIIDKIQQDKDFATTIDKVQQDKGFATTIDKVQQDKGLAHDEQGGKFEAVEPEHELNAFCVRMFCIEEPYHNNVLEVIKQAFNHYPDRDYCVITVPTAAVEIGHFPVIQTRIGKPESECLYVMNRFALSEPISVRKTDLKIDSRSVKKLLSGMPNEAEILRNFRLCEYDFLAIRPHDEQSIKISHISLVAVHQGQIVGVAVLKSVDSHSSFVAQYEIENFIKEIHHDFCKKPVVLVHMIVNPLFEHQCRWFFDEIMRITAVTTIFYPVDDTAKRDHATLKIAKTELVPVKRRRQIQYPNNIQDGNVIRPPHDFCMQLITSSILHEPKIIVNAKILVVGASDAGLSFLEALVYAPHLRFSNLTLISSDGIPIPDTSYVKSECFTPTELKQVGLDYYVDVIKSVTTEIDRVHKSVKLANGLRLAYDYLILTPGIQFDVRSLSPSMLSIDGVFGVQKVNEQRIFEAIKKFVFSRATVLEFEDVDASTARRPNIVVYGKHIQAYTTVQTLMSKGVAANFIHLVIPKSKVEHQGTFDNLVVEDMILTLCRDLGITVHISFKLCSWETNQATQKLSTIVIKSQEDKRSSLRLANIEMFLYADERAVDEDTYRAINDSCLVFDGLFVIDKYFRTQDSSIFAAGSLCKYSSRYKTPWSHSLYNSREVGRELAKLILPLFDPVQNPGPLNDDNLVLQFTEPKVISSVLPGGLTYLHFDRPRLPTQTLERRRKLPSYGRDCINSKPEIREYFRINIDPTGTIQSLTYIGVRPIPVKNMCCLYGMNERTLNRFVARFDEEVPGIPDFISFFSEEWALPLFHDRFPEFMKRLTEDMFASKSSEFQSLVAKMGKLSSFGSEIIKESDRKVMYEYFDRLPARKEWDKKLFDYLSECEIYKSYP